MSTPIFVPGVKTGFWTNHDHGHVQGATLTLSAGDGGYLIAFLALFISVAGTQVWVMLRFGLHQLNTRRKTPNAFCAQQQLVLRNSEGTLNTAWRLFQISWAWRKSESYALTRCLHFTLLALLVSVTFSVGSIFSSQVSKAAGSKILIRSHQCGFPDWSSWVLFSSKSPGTDWAKFNTDLIALSYHSDSKILSARSFAQACYSPVTNRKQCSLYVQRRLNWTTISNTSCPFDDLCILEGTRSLQLDTGLVDSHRDLGINSPPENRISYRKVMTCAPIRSQEFSSFHNSFSVLRSDSPRHDYTLLKPSIEDTNWAVQGPFHVLTYGVSRTGNSLDSPTSVYNIQDSYNMLGYSMGTLKIYDFTRKIWSLFPQLNRTDADIILYFLAANSIEYASPVDDPWFSAHRNLSYNTWASDSYQQALGCTDQYQICNPNTGQCYPLDGFHSEKPRPQIGLNEYQNQTAAIIMDMEAQISGPDVIEVLVQDALLASRLQQFVSGISSPLPDHQWMLEVSWWFAITLAHLQQAIVEYATGPSPEHLLNGQAVPLHVKGDPNSTVTRAICNSQMIQSTGEYQNFSVLGLCCILVIGGTIMFVSLYIESLVGFVQRKLRMGQEGRSRWMADSYFQVQRMMYEGRGYGKWKGHMDTVPVYLGDDLQFSIELEDGRFELVKGKATEEMDMEASPEAKGGGVIEIVEAERRSGTTASLEEFSV